MSPKELPDSSCEEENEVEASCDDVPTSDEEAPVSDEPVSEEMSEVGDTEMGVNPNSLKNGCSKACPAEIRLSELNTSIF